MICYQNSPFHSVHASFHYFKKGAKTATFLLSVFFVNFNSQFCIQAIQTKLSQNFLNPVFNFFRCFHEFTITFLVVLRQFLSIVIKNHLKSPLNYRHSPEFFFQQLPLQVVDDKFHKRYYPIWIPREPFHHS